MLPSDPAKGPLISNNDSSHGAPTQSLTQPTHTVTSHRHLTLLLHDNPSHTPLRASHTDSAHTTLTLPKASKMPPKRFQNRQKRSKTAPIQFPARISNGFLTGSERNSHNTGIAMTGWISHSPKVDASTTPNGCRRATRNPAELNREHGSGWKKKGERTDFHRHF